MSTLLSIGDILQARFYCYFVGQLAINNIAYEVLSTTGTPMLEDVVVALDGLAAPLYLPCLTNGAQYYGCALNRYKPTLTYAATSNGNAASGTAGLAPCPTVVTGIITKRTSIPKQGGRGRLYIPFPDESLVDNVLVVPTNAYRTAMLNLATALLPPGGVPLVTFGSTITLTPGVLRVDQPHHVPPITYHFQALTTFNIPRKFAQQHRRGNYGALNQLPF